MSKLRSKLINRITQQGPISVADYMHACLFDPEDGYYLTQSPIGRDGDFITAPEVSQLFGEMIGLWLLNQMGQSTDIALIELGPGRGTLMSDILRTVSRRQNCMSVHLLEINPALMNLQKEALKNYDVTWDDSLTPLLERCAGKITFIIANEFFDVFPIKQYIYQGQWFERLINYNTTFFFDVAQQPTLLETPLTPKAGDIYEIRANPCFSQLLDHVSRHKGGMLIIDYGYTQPLYGDSLQALQNHQYVDVFTDPGRCDLTAHVNFWQMLQLIRGRASPYLTTQGQFLRDHGIQVRAEKLMHNKPAAIQKQILSGLDRLTSPSQMGELFKVLEVQSLTKI